jgi:hypothetical protein
MVGLHGGTVILQYADLGICIDDYMQRKKEWLVCMAER